MKYVFIALITLLLSSAALSEEMANSTSNASPLLVSKSRVSSTAPGALNSAVYFTLRNISNKTIQLLGAHSDAAQIVEIHEHAMKNGLMSMQKVSSIAIPAGTEMVFEPGGYHIMLMNINTQIKEGDVIEFSLVLKDERDLSVMAVAK